VTIGIPCVKNPDREGGTEFLSSIPVGSAFFTKFSHDGEKFIIEKQGNGFRTHRYHGSVENLIFTNVLGVGCCSVRKSKLEKI